MGQKGLVLRHPGAGRHGGASVLRNLSGTVPHTSEAVPMSTAAGHRDRPLSLQATPSLPLERRRLGNSFQHDRVRYGAVWALL